MGTDPVRAALGDHGSELRAPDSDIEPGIEASGLVVGGCRLHEPLGHGATGTVYRATQIALDREVAVKLVAPLDADPSVAHRFQREMRTAASLGHPHAIPIYDAGEEDGLLYLVMRLIAGPNLGSLVARNGPLATARAVALIDQVAGALDAAHAAGLVHRDIKPANVLVERADEGEAAYITDFGLVRQIRGGTAITRMGEWVGTAEYVAPEQLLGAPIDARADVYALTGVLYTALTGRPPFERANSTATARAHVEAEPPRLDGVPGAEGLSDVIARGMAKRPDARYATAGELARAAVGAAEAARTAVDSAATADAALDRDAALDSTATTPPLRGRTAATSPAFDRSADPRADRTGIRRYHPARPRAGALAPTERLRVAARPAPSRRRRPRRWVIVAPGLAALVGLAGLAFALRPTATTHALSGSRRASVAMSGPTSLGSFRARFPAGWRLAEIEQPRGAYLRTEAVSPTPGQAIIIDRTPDQSLSATQAGLGVRQATIARTPGYREVSEAPSTLAGRRVLVWSFTLAGLPDGARVDIFERVGTDGYAVLGEGANLDAITPLALAVAASISHP